MTSPALIFLSALMLVASSCAFLFGFVHAGIDPDAMQNGILIGILSAWAWGVASMGASASFSGWATIFAAMFATMSLGFLAPADDACKGAHALVEQACHLRAVFR